MFEQRILSVSSSNDYRSVSAHYQRFGLRLIFWNRHWTHTCQNSAHHSCISLCDYRVTHVDKYFSGLHTLAKVIFDAIRIDKPSERHRFGRIIWWTWDICWFARCAARRKHAENWFWELSPAHYNRFSRRTQTSSLRTAVTQVHIWWQAANGKYLFLNKF